MTDEEMAEEYLQGIEGDDCVIITDREERKQAFLAGLKAGSKLDRVWHDYDAGEDCYEDSHEGRWVKRDEIYQLTRAKDIITNLVKFDGSYKDDEEYQRKCELYDKMWEEAEQFLKEE